MGEYDAEYAAAAQLGSTAINAVSAAQANKKQRKWMEEQYYRQRADNLADWHMQNQYNSPAAQMERLKAGGLNPNLVYGDGANTPSVNIRGTDTQTYRPEVPHVDLTGAANSFLQSTALKNTQAQTDNLKAQNALIQQQIVKTAAETQAIGTTTETSEFNLQQLKTKASTDVAIQEAQLGKTLAETAKVEADTQYTLNQDERSALINNQNLQKGFLEIANLRATNDSIRQGIRNQETQRQLMELDKALKDTGIQPHDPAYIRLGKKLYEALPTPKKFKQIVDSTIRELKNKGLDRLNNYKNNLNPPPDPVTSKGGM